jgi:curved DNA-binding protein CbpA
VREVFRKLASELHPDRETDPAEHARKTELMQRVNQAYKAGDLCHSP